MCLGWLGGARLRAGGSLLDSLQLTTFNPEVLGALR
jgi:hypothetical protein